VTGASEGPATETDLSDADLPEFARLVESFGVGATPRTVKRFINVYLLLKNVYLLLKSVDCSRGWSMSKQGQVAVLLAIATGFHDLAGELLPSLAAVQPCILRTALVDPAGGEASSAAGPAERLAGHTPNLARRRTNWDGPLGRPHLAFPLRPRANTRVTSRHGGLTLPCAANLN
jgi:hypothetical protein